MTLPSGPDAYLLAVALGRRLGPAAVVVGRLGIEELAAGRDIKTSTDLDIQTARAKRDSTKVLTQLAKDLDVEEATTIKELVMVGEEGVPDDIDGLLAESGALREDVMPVCAVLVKVSWSRTR